jgi:hypothetical protein
MVIPLIMQRGRQESLLLHMKINRYLSVKTETPIKFCLFQK